jgi:hypothetical protein
MIIDIPIEPLDMRYTKQWGEWFKDYFKKQRSRVYQVVGSPLTDKIEQGAFLDVCGTHYYKASQLMRIAEIIHAGGIRDDDIFFFHDLWFPGIEALAYMRDALGIKFKITGIFHAGTYDPTDWISEKGMGRWGEPLENSWLKFIDKIFVGTEFHRQLFLRNRFQYDIADKVVVTGFPLKNIQRDHTVQKDNIIVFPHRLNEDKNPRYFEYLKDWMNRSDYQFIETHRLHLDKNSYYELLQKAKFVVSFATHENYGISIREAIMCECFPVVPVWACYPEFIPKEFLHNGTPQNCGQTIFNIMACPIKYFDLLKKTEGRIRTIAGDSLPKILVELDAIGNVL